MNPRTTATEGDDVTDASDATDTPQGAVDRAEGLAAPVAAGPRPVRSASTIAMGTFLILAAGVLVLVMVVGDRAPLWMIASWLVLALAVGLVVGALVPAGDESDRGR